MTSHEGFLKSRFDPKIVTLCLDMFYKGASLGKITQHVAQFYGAKISHVTILKWVRKFSELIDNYANTLRPQLSGVWNCDEMKTKMAHEEPINGERFYWLWNAFDNGSRYLIASHLTRGRGHKDAREFFKVAKKQAKKDPRVIFSDGLDSYRGEYRPSSNAPVVHIANVGIRSHMGNHRVERLHNSIREREKVMRHLKKAKSAEKVFKGYRAYYNYVRPHMALENHTPAEMAAIPIQLGTNRWLDNQTSSETHQGGELSNQALEEG